MKNVLNMLNKWILRYPFYFYLISFHYKQFALLNLLPLTAYSSAKKLYISIEHDHTVCYMYRLFVNIDFIFSMKVIGNHQKWWMHR